ncbi:hypothetical protein E1A91_D05G293000v1 [Gossypium mustelinum]|uniref:Prolamin-like domain-containing protein n=1 Tax=Gossypium mustelinum TaxID=34275 RepID=A0A5D2V2D1_GOSMU|nr:hypothetical protein E1A91_D05G293000v1 [Gossypium mustelinum]
MANTFKLFSTLTLLFLALPMASSLETSKLTLQSRLNADSPSCWESLTQIQSCTGEVILFFINGETYLGDSCCHAIHTVSHQCWPNMLETLGYTTEEGDILEGYCDHETSKSPPSVKASVVASANDMLP